MCQYSAKHFGGYFFPPLKLNFNRLTEKIRSAMCDMVRIITSRQFYVKLIVWVIVGFVVGGGGGGGSGGGDVFSHWTHTHTMLFFLGTRCDEILWYVLFIPKLHWHLFCFCFCFCFQLVLFHSVLLEVLLEIPCSCCCSEPSNGL